MRFLYAGIILVVYLFALMIGYYAVSTPFENLMDGIDDADGGLAADEIDTHVGNYKTFFNMAFALMAITPIVWFIFWVFHREPDWRYYR